jgi:hypothetical protein
MQGEKKLKIRKKKDYEAIPGSEQREAVSQNESELEPCNIRQEDGGPGVAPVS